MKKTILLLFLALYALLGRAQETPPQVNTMKQLTIATRYFNPADSSIWTYKGPVIGWHREGKYSDILKKNARIDSLLSVTAKLNGDQYFTGALKGAGWSIFNNGTTLLQNVTANGLGLSTYGLALRDDAHPADPVRRIYYSPSEGGNTRVQISSGAATNAQSIAYLSDIETSTNNKIDSLQTARNLWVGDNLFSNLKVVGDSLNSGSIKFKNSNGTFSDLTYGSGDLDNKGHLNWSGDYFRTKELVTNNLRFGSDTSTGVKLSAPFNTQRYQTFQNKDGQLALTSDLSAFAKRDSSALSVFQNASKTNLYEKAKAVAAPLKGITIEPFAASNLILNYNYVDGYTIQYIYNKNADGIFIQNGAYFGKTISYTSPTITLAGTYNTSSVNSYTTIANNTFTFKFHGTGLTFNTFTDARGGIWEFNISSLYSSLNLTKQQSVWSASTVSTANFKIWQNLPENDYIVTATFKGDDPAHIPSGGTGTSRGWLKYNVAAMVTATVNATIGVVDPLAKSTIIPTQTRDEFAISYRAKGTTDVLHWNPIHNGVPNTSQAVKTAFKADDLTLPTPDSINSYKTVKKIVLTQSYDAYYAAGGIKYWEGLLSRTFDENGVTVGHTLNVTSSDIEIGSAYLMNMSANPSLLNKLQLGDTTTDITIPGSGVTDSVRVNKPSDSFEFRGLVQGNNVSVAGTSNLKSLIDYPNSPYAPSFSTQFYTQRSGAVKIYNRIAFPANSFKAGNRITVLNRYLISRVPGINDTTRVSEITNTLPLNTLANTPTAAGHVATKSYVDGLAPGFSTNTTTVALNSTTLNSSYPTAPIGFRVICGNISGGGVIYTKFSTSGWLATSALVQP